ncbi:hypothetical protein F2P81_002673 [Scophthalmus maximus]|uniref:Uncharacterized protein n=1 Tax=Scophthalmus maximus TaxID=52904 RepID=A0A6A4TSD0_SCOMX|nr:hypothetical protein F2P81_002673 [Scophthalmus maximus]
MDDAHGLDNSQREITVRRDREQLCLSVVPLSETQSVHLHSCCRFGDERGGGAKGRPSVRPSVCPASAAAAAVNKRKIRNERNRNCGLERSQYRSWVESDLKKISNLLLCRSPALPGART